MFAHGEAIGHAGDIVADRARQRRLRRAPGGRQGFRLADEDVEQRPDDAPGLTARAVNLVMAVDIFVEEGAKPSEPRSV